MHTRDCCSRGGRRGKVLLSLLQTGTECDDEGVRVQDKMIATDTRDAEAGLLACRPFGWAVGPQGEAVGAKTGKERRIEEGGGACRRQLGEFALFKVRILVCHLDLSL